MDLEAFEEPERRRRRELGTGWFGHDSAPAVTPLPRDQTPGWVSSSGPCPLRPRPLSSSRKYLAAQEPGRAKAWPLETEREKQKTRFQRTDAQNGGPGHGWQSPGFSLEGPGA